MWLLPWTHPSLLWWERIQAQHLQIPKGCSSQLCSLSPRPPPISHHAGCCPTPSGGWSDSLVRQTRPTRNSKVSFKSRSLVKVTLAIPIRWRWEQAASQRYPDPVCSELLHPCNISYIFINTIIYWKSLGLWAFHSHTTPNVSLQEHKYSKSVYKCVIICFTLYSAILNVQLWAALPQAEIVFMQSLCCGKQVCVCERKLVSGKQSRKGTSIILYKRRLPRASQDRLLAAKPCQSCEPNQYHGLKPTTLRMW